MHFKIRFEKGQKLFLEDTLVLSRKYLEPSF
jgi:hypothetical protein